MIHRNSRADIEAPETEWVQTPIQKISAFVTKGATPTTYGFNWERDGVIFLRSECVSERGLDLAQSMFISNRAHEILSRGEVRAGDILMTITGNVGRVVQLGSAFGYANINQHIARIRVNDPRVSAAFVYHYLSQNKVRSRYATITTGQAYPQISLQQVRETLIPLPDLSEQQTIAEALGDVDALLGALTRLIAKKRDLKQAAMQQLLTGKTRLPGFSGEWEVKRLGDIGKCLRGVSYRGDSDLFPHDTPRTKRLLRSNNVQRALVVARDIQFVNQERVSAQQIMRNDDILVCMANGSKDLVGKAGLFKLSDGYDYTFGAFMGVFRTLSGLADAGFVFCLFQTNLYRDYINNLLAGSSINNLRPSSIESLEFSVPNTSEQTAIATVLSDMDAELAALDARLAKTRALKQGMMQELLTGKTRLV